MKISEIGGEFELLKRIGFAESGADILVPNGDDAAVFKVGTKILTISVDSFVEGTHFDIEWIPPEQLGRKVIEASMSDVVAMGGCPQYAFVSLTLPEIAEVDAIEDLYCGMREALSRMDSVLLGGDLTQGTESLVISITAVGKIDSEQHVCTRSGAQPGDLIFVSGSPGDAAAGLDVLKKELSEWPLLVERHLDPKCRDDLVDRIAPIASSMIDISDGLSSEVRHICRMSGVGCRIDQAAIPLSQALSEYAAEQELNAYDFVWGGGEDFELLFTVNPADAQQVAGRAVQIGEIVESGMTVVIDGEESELPAVGWKHFR